MEVLEILIGVLVIVVMAAFAYMSAHIVEEKKKGKQIPMFWEKKEKKMGYGKGYSKKPAKKPVKKRRTQNLKSRLCWTCALTWRQLEDESGANISRTSAEFTRECSYCDTETLEACGRSSLR